MTASEAQEYTESLAQIFAGSWREWRELSNGRGDGL